ncbi:hypothetical protein A1O1_07297 [Capronia coronata CBS 617.96]|uniref:Uncharacterized protein n=1 Tax=Capronia coronata CBS 617.96 TaxID=1182541 RepID=W9XTV9_9EURO|nr:uncharacterized protein A1O1_07297 [Capronia coronata CBS 617.96]EXJ83673.1 hypothetical protein A1O1_07297 [Capronia coronata CBS 617.96]
MKVIDQSRFYRILGLPHETSLDELDERYLQLTLHLSGPNGPDNKEEARLQQELVDQAYNALLARFLHTAKEIRPPSDDSFTMKQVLVAQDRIQPPSHNDDDLWISPESSRSSGCDSKARRKTVVDRGQAPGFSVQAIEGDIFDAPDRAVIVHAVNCQGVWGYGIAAQLKKAFPAAYRVYRSYCQHGSAPWDLVGTSLLIPPQPEDFMEEQNNGTVPKLGAVKQPSAIVFEKRHWIACLFTGVGYGKPNTASSNPGKDSQPRILRRTMSALEHLRIMLEEFGPSNFNEDTNWQSDDDKPGEIWCCKFNSGAFGVDWEETRALVEEEFMGFERPWTVVTKVDKVTKSYRARDG